MMNLRIGVALSAALLLSALAGCAGDPATTPSPAAPGTVSIVLDRVGGNAGVRDHVVLNPDGTWSATDKSGATRTGSLSADQTASVYQLVMSAAFASEAAQPSGGERCMDAPTVTLTAGDRKVIFIDCGTAGAPATAAAVLKVFQERVLA